MSDAAPQDARFADADEGPLRLRALDPEDLTVLSALVQDAVTQVGEVGWHICVGQESRNTQVLAGDGG